jgi:hypothetical protein
VLSSAATAARCCCTNDDFQLQGDDEGVGQEDVRARVGGDAPGRRGDALREQRQPGEVVVAHSSGPAWRHSEPPPPPPLSYTHAVMPGSRRASRLLTRGLGQGAGTRLGAISREPLIRDCPPLQPADLERVQLLLTADPIPLTELRRYVGSRAGLGTLLEPRVDDATHADQPSCTRALDGETQLSEGADSEAVRRLRPLMWKVRRSTQQTAPIPHGLEMPDLWELSRLSLRPA